MDKPKIGAGHLDGMLRKGFKELGAGLIPAFPGHAPVIEESGVFGNLTPGEIADAKGKEAELDANQEPGRQSSWTPRRDLGGDDKNRGMERG